MKTFYLGIHRPAWLARPEFADVPVFISRRVFYDPRRSKYNKKLPRATGRYAIDSGGFTELQKHGRWTITPAEYVAFLRRLWNEVGHFDFAAPMDLMCEPWVILGGTHDGITYAGSRHHLANAQPDWTLDDYVREHQRLTTANYLELRHLAPELPILPVIQGWKRDDYIRHVRDYRAAGVDLRWAAAGSMCRRQNTDEAADIIDTIRAMGVQRIHAFGFKIQGVRQCWYQIDSADSMSWSLDGRHSRPCTHDPTRRGEPAAHEGNCIHYALAWRRKNIQQPAQRPAHQLDLLVHLGLIPAA